MHVHPTWAVDQVLEFGEYEHLQAIKLDAPVDLPHYLSGTQT